MSLGLFAHAFVGSAVGLWLVSQITEALRPVPQTAFAPRERLQLIFTQSRRTQNLQNRRFLFRVQPDAGSPVPLRPLLSRMPVKLHGATHTWCILRAGVRHAE